MKLKLINGLMFGVVLYLLIDKYKKKKPCTCSEKENNSPATTTIVKDEVLESTNVIPENPVSEVLEPKPICPFKAFALYIGMKKYIFTCANGGIMKVTYDLMDGQNYGVPITSSYRQEKISESEFLEYDKIKQAGTNDKPKKPEEV